MTSYNGMRDQNRRAFVFKTRRADLGAGTYELSPVRSLEVRNHSPDGFEWGYAGSGPAQLALGILLDHLGDVSAASRLYQDFKFDCIAGLPFDRWEITPEEINMWLQDRARGKTYFKSKFDGGREVPRS